MRMSRAEAIRRQVATLVEELARIETRPEEPPEGTVIRFDMHFGRSGTVYDYAAIHAGDGLWYTTGPRSPKGYTWDQLLDWMEQSCFGFRLLRPGKKVDL